MADQPFDIHKAAGILIRDRKLLVEKSFNKDFYLAPGGKIKPGETPEQALIRELEEEFSIKVNIEDISPFGTFYAPSATNQNQMLRMDTFVVHKWQGEPTASNEVEKIAWLDSAGSKTVPIGSIWEHEILPRLLAENLID